MQIDGNAAIVAGGASGLGAATARLFHQRGAHVTIAAFSLMVGTALKAAEQLATEGIDAEIIDLRSLRPLDTATIVASVKKTNRLVKI